MASWMKWALGALIGSGMVGGGYYAYKKATFEPTISAWSIIPDNAIYVIESKEPVKAWKKASRSELWTHLRTHPFFGEINSSATFLDSLIEKNPKIFEALGSQPLTISAHPLSSRKYDFLYFMDVREKNAGLLKEIIKPVLKDLNENISVTEHQGTEIIQVKDQQSKETLNLTVISNILVASYALPLIYKTIDEKNQHRLDVHPDLTEMRKLISSDEQFNVYVQFEYFDDLLKMYSPDDDGLYKSLCGMLTFAGMKGEIGDTKVHLQGLLHLNDTTHSYLKALRNVKEGNRKAHKIASYRTAFYTGLLFDNYVEVWQKLQEELKHDPDAYAETRKQQDRIEKLLNINIETDFLAWMKNEVALLTMRDVANTGREEKVLILHTQSKEDAQTGLGKIMKQIRKRTPLKFRTISYKDYEINILDMKGFFKLILGKMFQKFDKPYFTYVDDFVVMSNSLETLQDFLDDYEAKKTLARDDTFSEMESQFTNDGHLFTYVSMKNAFPTLRHHLNPKDWMRMLENESYFLACRALGLTLTGKETHYTMDFRLQYQPLAPVSEGKTEEIATEEILSPADSLALQKHPDGPYEEHYRNDKLKVKAYYKKGKVNGDFKSYYRNGNLQTQGRFREGLKADIWYYYNRKGKLVRKETYNEKSELVETKIMD